ncbi:MAG: hypothetical protein J0L87_11085 [Bacteroidetes bacterium]|nr:hypothetical protein [Bacteroidota bacterium]
MTKNKKILLIILIILNTVVLMGQIYPEGAPPFARIVNIVFLIASLIFFIILIKQKNDQ